jgi:hypothetical protein
MMAEATSSAPLTMAQMLSFFEKMMETNAKQTKEMIATIVSEIRKPPVDPVKEVQRAREKETKERGEKEYWEKKAARKKNCSHTRQNGTSNIAWARQSDGIERGVCPYCNSDFTPADGELYIQLQRMPRGMIESVRYVA